MVDDSASASRARPLAARRIAIRVARPKEPGSQAQGAPGRGSMRWGQLAADLDLWVMRRATVVSALSGCLVFARQGRGPCPLSLHHLLVSTSSRTISLANALATGSASSRPPARPSGGLDQGERAPGVIVRRSGRTRPVDFDTPPVGDVSQPAYDGAE